MMFPFVPDEKQFSDEQLSLYLEDELGFDLSRVDLANIISNVLRDGADGHTFEKYSSAISSLIAVHETYFLRHQEQFDWLENVWLPRLVSELNGRTVIKILSAGCSTGEEPYSILAHLQPLLDPLGVRLEIDAVDISQNALDVANKGRYGLWSLRGVNAEQESSWLDVKSRNVYVKAWVREGVNFSRFNITQPFPGHMQGCYDLVLCRNVMIYMHSSAISKVYNNLLSAIREDGLIMPGPSDPNPEEGGELQVIWENAVRLYAHKEHAHQAAVGEFSAAVSPANVFEQASFSSASDSESNTSFLSQYACETTNNNYQSIECLLSNCQYELARKALELNIAIDPLDLRSYVMLATMALDLDELQLAISALRKAIFLKPHSPYIAYLSANYKNKIGDLSGEKKDLLWLRDYLLEQQENAPVEFCEEITIRELQGVVDARIR